jgi:N-acetylneuraminic acid mutarotase
MKRTVLSGAIVLGFALSVITPFAAKTQSASGGVSAWSVKAPLPRTNSEFGVAEIDGKIYVMGGYPADRKTVAEVQVYDSKADKWQIIAPLPQALNHIMPAAVNGKIYVIGGQTTESSEPDKAGFVNTV